MGGLPFFRILKIISTSLYASLKFIYFHGRPTHFKIQKIGLFSQATCLFSNSKKEFQQASMLP
jgi:hypothetical protein